MDMQGPTTSRPEQAIGAGRSWPSWPSRRFARSLQECTGFKFRAAPDES